MRPVQLLLGLVYICLPLACGSNEDDSTVTSESACVAGNSVACAGPNGCIGYQICRTDGSGFNSCICDATSSSAGGAKSATGGFGSTPSTGAGLGGSNATSTRMLSSSATGGVPVASSGASLGGQYASSSPVTGQSCAPADASGLSYPPYKPARHLPASCTSTDVRTYYADCYVAGNCGDFAPGGSKSKCGECLSPTGLDAEAYGPLIRLGSPTGPLDETNMAGCIELMGEGQCAKKMMIATLCEYNSCATNCAVTDSASYQALASCMLDARSSTCSAAEREAVCISSSAHVAACSASGFEAQFVAIATVFCVN